jgi:DNA-binding CsgD family transcriptional regulator
MRTGVGERAHQEVVRLAHRGLDLFTFLRRTEEQLRRVIDYEGAACFFTIDPATLLLTGHINEDLAQDDERRRAVNAGVAHNEYREQDYNKFASLAKGPSRAGSLAEATEGRPERSPRYGSLIRPFGLEGELRAAFVADGACWGGLALFRTPDQTPFKSEGRRFLEGLSRHVAEGIRTSLVLGEIEREMGPETPGLILLDGAGRVEALNQSAAHYLEELIDPGSPGPGALPEVVYAVAEEARRGATGEGGHGPVRHRVPTRTGGWVILHGTLFEGKREGSAVIIEPARAPEIAPLLLEAHGLSDREQAVTLCVLRGISTVDIAERLFISPYTVQDHLKAIFEKVGVRSRKALVAKVFFDHYFPRMQEEDPIGSVQPFEEVSGLAAVD